MTGASSSANHQVARAAGTVMVAFALSNIFGLVRQILISNIFGTDRAIDAFYAASTYPDLIFNLVAGGALASAFIPTFTGFLTKDDREMAWRLASSITNLVLLLLTVVSAISAIFALPIVRYILAGKFPLEQQNLTASLLRILLLSPAIFGVSGLLMGILNAHQRFLLPALAPAMYWLGMIVGLVFLTPSMGIYGLAWGAVLGAALHLGIQIPGLLRLPGRIYTFTLGLANAAVREVGRLMGPRLLGVAVVQLNFVVNVIIASGLPEGSLSAIKYAWAVMTMPQVVIAQAVAIAALPTFSAQFAQGKTDEMRATLASTLRGMLLLSVPAAVGLILLRQPMTALLFQHGVFDAHSTEMVSWALLWYAIGLVGHSILEVLARAFYAQHDTKTPVIVGAVAMGLNVVFSFAFSSLFENIGWMPHGGLALANSFATALEATTLLIIMSKRLKGIHELHILRGGLQSIAGALAMSVVVTLCLRLFSNRPAWLLAISGLAAGGLVYVLMMITLRVPELGALVGVVRQKVRISNNSSKKRPS